MKTRRVLIAEALRAQLDTGQPTDLRSTSGTHPGVARFATRQNLLFSVVGLSRADAARMTRALRTS